MATPEVPPQRVPPQGGSPWIVSVDATTFERDVLQRSLELPVVVDFTATWCGPCAQLGPRLEAAARAADGGFLLAKIDIDQNPELVSAFGVQSVPTVVVLAGGRVVDGFQGALPEAELAGFLERVAPGAGGPPPVLEEAAEHAVAGDVEAAIDLLRAHLRSSAEDVPARAALAGYLVDAGRPAEGRKVLERLSAEEREDEAVKAVLARLQLAEGAGDLPALRAAAEAAPEDVAARTALGKALLATGDYEAGLGELLEAVRLEPEDKASEARKAMLEAFDALGLEDPIANRFRFELSLLLFA